MKRPLLIVGAGGHAKVVAEAAKLAGYAIAGFIDESPDRWNTELLGIRVLGNEHVLDTPQLSDCVVIVAVGDNTARSSIVERMMARKRRFATIVHPSAVISPSAILGEGTVVLAGAVVNSMAKIAT